MIEFSLGFGPFWVRWLAFLLPDPADPGSITSTPEKLPEEKIIHVAEVNLRRCLEKSGQWLENVYQTHLLLASGKMVQQKTLEQHFHKCSQQ